MRDGRCSMRLCGMLVLVVTVCSCRESRRRIMLRKAENERLKSVRRRKVALKHKATRERVNASAQYVHARARACRCYVCAWLAVCACVSVPVPCLCLCAHQCTWLVLRAAMGVCEECT